MTQRNLFPYFWLVIILMTAFWGMIGLNRIGVAYLFPVIVPEFKMSFTQAGVLISGTSVTWAISAWFGGWLADRIGRLRVLLPASAFAFVSTAAMGGTGGFWSMFVVREAIGLGDGVGWPTAQSIIAEEVPPRRRALAQGLMPAGYSLIGSGLGAIIVSGLIVAVGWRLVFPIVAVAGLLLTVAMWRLLREPPRSTERRTVSWREAFTILRRPRMIILALLQSFSLSYLYLVISYNPLFLTQVKKVSVITEGTVMTVWGVVAVGGAVLLPWLSDYVGRKPVVIGSALVAATALLFYLLGSFALPVMAVLLAISSFAHGPLTPLVAATCVVENVEEDVRATAMGVANFVAVVLGTLVAPVLGGVVADHLGLSTAVGLAAGTSLLLAGLMMFLPETAPRVLAKRGADLAATAS